MGKSGHLVPPAVRNFRLLVGPKLCSRPEQLAQGQVATPEPEPLEVATVEETNLLLLLLRLGPIDVLSNLPPDARI
eukprot:5719622-Amphidinium_carterae.1